MERTHARRFLVLAACWVTLPVRGAVEFVTNGTFEGGFGAMIPAGPLDVGPDVVPLGWNRVETFSGGVPEVSSVLVVGDNGPSAPGALCTEFRRTAGDNASGDWTAVEQPLAINAAQYQSLTLSLDVKVLQHNLVAGGWVAPAFEWPVTVQIDYLDTGGVGQIWRHGWYLAQPGDGPPGPINDPGGGTIPFYNDLLVPQNVWVPNAFNLFVELPGVASITKLRVGGSGWLFEGRADNLSLLGVPAQVPIPEPGTLVLLAVGLLAARRRRH